MVVLRSYGAEGLRQVIRNHVALAQSLAARVSNHPRLDLVAPIPFSLVCFRHKDGNEATRSLADAINRSGHSYVTPSSVDDMMFIRVSIGQAKTDDEHIDRLWGSWLRPTPELAPNPPGGCPEWPGW